MELLRAAAPLLLLLAALLCDAQTGPGCECKTNKRVVNCVLQGEECKCLSFGSNVSVSCNTLTSKCLLMKAEMAGMKHGRRDRPKHAFVDNDGIYDPDCEENGIFKARQCDNSSCWCVNTAGVRRTEKGDKDFKCTELVRTHWIIIETEHGSRGDVDVYSLERALRDLLKTRYMLDEKYIDYIEYKKPLVIIELKQNASQKSTRDVDIADVAYYFEKDVKDDTLFHGEKLSLSVNAEPLVFEKTLIYYVDEKPPEFSMKHLTNGVIAVIVVVVLAIVAGIIVLIVTNRRRGKYEKHEIKEMNEMHRELNA
ncbi:epithelial cell adhesion molecule [Alligator mississippiensis]|uniref:Epithelial cell adhesion molecule n=2 Tax=Alligator mississippiensis TaxID=8496 RepID=A0A151NWR9_ALLMI|nr:epithelial cell adhesion molecule [Alligator mississippiensis]KYO41214.1 epithelial cell adhesion molecule [Alligator mississippiensis]